MVKALKALALVLLILFVSLAQPGCWDQREIERLGIVLATGLDDAPDGRIRVTVQTINPRALAGGGGGGSRMGGGGEGGGGRGFRNRSAEGGTIFDCIRLLSLESPRQLYFAHNQVILISEELARTRGIEELVDFFDRNPQIRRSNWILIARSDISSILELPGELAGPASQRIAGIIRGQRLNSFYPDIQLGDFMEFLETEGTDTYAMGIQVEPNEPEIRNDQTRTEAEIRDEAQIRKSIGYNLHLGGTAVFRDNKLAGWLDERESRGLLWVRNKARGGVIIVPCPGIQQGGQNSQGGHFSVEILRAKSKIRPEITDGILAVTVKVRVQGNIQESGCAEELAQPEVIRKVERALEDAVRGEVEAALAKAQLEYGADIFGFGEAVHRANPALWREIKAGWRNIYPNLPVYLEVEGKIARTGLVTRPVRPTF